MDEIIVVFCCLSDALRCFVEILLLLEEAFCLHKGFLTTIVFNYTYQMDSILTRTTVFTFLMMVWAFEGSVFLRGFLTLFYLRPAGLRVQLG